MITYSRFTLPNGLRVVHHYAPGYPMAAVDVLYNVGSRDESPELTGIAHLLEHYMFGGSVNIPEYSPAIQAAGGKDNAWTSNDFTSFYSMLPAVNVETAFWLESDRMLSLAFDPRPLDVQRSVVCEEFKQTCLNQPYGDLMHHLRRLLYSVHPYRYPVIGKELSHIEKTTLDDVRDFFMSHYAPNNAVLAVAGDITLERCRELAEKWFGPIPARPVKPREYPREPERTEPVEEIVAAQVPHTFVAVAFPMPAYGDPGYNECDIISDILSNGRSARFHQNIVMRNRLFLEADASISGSEEPGFFLLTAVLSQPGLAEAREAARIMVDEALKLTVDEPTEHELHRAANRFASKFTFDSMKLLEKTQQLAMAEMHGEDINDTVARYRAVTTADILATARRVLDPAKAVTLIYGPVEASQTPQ